MFIEIDWDMWNLGALTYDNITYIFGIQKRIWL